jgi:DNA polymerase elongation subunit (family B)
MKQGDKLIPFQIFSAAVLFCCRILHYCSFKANTCDTLTGSPAFKVLHGIVDSIWVIKQGAVREDYLKLKEAIEQHTGFAISFEGIYKWVAFVHSKSSKGVQIMWKKVSKLQ